MKVGAIPQSLSEWLVTRAGLAPTPLVETFHAVILARAIIVATKLGVFDRLDRASTTAPVLADALAVNEAALEKLLNLLVASGYLGYRQPRYGLTRVSRKWMTRHSPTSLHDNMLMRFLEWEAIDETESFVRTGKALDVHDRIRDAEWDIYQRGMRSLARLSAPEVARRIRVPSGARTMLDIGGAHGAYSAAFCRRHRRLTATILDLPQALDAAAPLLADERLGERTVLWPGNALTEDLGRDRWDLIFIGHLLHHFDKAANRSLMARAARSLRAGGIIALLDVFKSAGPGRANQSGALLDLFFAITSNAGTWSFGEVTGWLTSAGLTPRPAVHLRTAPSISVLTAIRAARES